MAKKQITPKKSRVEKPFNNGTMSKAAFFGSIRATLRNSSRWWKPISEAKKLAKRAYKGPNKRQKWEYQCNICKGWFTDKEVAVDHIVEAGSLKDYNDLPAFVKNLFCEVDGLQVLCNKRLDGKDSCHILKTRSYMNSRKTNAEK